MAMDRDGASFGNTYLYHQLDSYAWDEDQEFQGGLRAILGSTPSQQQIEHLTLRAKCYYYARKSGTPVDFEGYKYWVETSGAQAPSLSNGTAHASHVDSYAASVAIEEPASIAAQDAAADAPSASTDDALGAAPKPVSFQEICDMIAEGKPIPGIKDIPDTVLEGQASETKAERRRKPWETATEPAERASWMT